MTSESRETPRERILGAAYDLFSQHGVQAVGVDRVVKDAAVAKASLYKSFGSKENLVVAALDRREQVWTRKWLEEGLSSVGGSPGARLLAIFDLFAEWFRRKDFESCMFIRTLLEAHNDSEEISEAAIAGLKDVRSLVQAIAEEAGATDPPELARRWQILMSGSIVSATQGVSNSATDAREIAILILDDLGIAH